MHSINCNLPFCSYFLRDSTVVVRRVIVFKFHILFYAITNNPSKFIRIITVWVCFKVFIRIYTKFIFTASSARELLRAKSLPVSQANSTSVRMSLSKTCIEFNKGLHRRGVSTRGSVLEWMRTQESERKRRQCTQKTYRKMWAGR